MALQLLDALLLTHGQRKIWLLCWLFMYMIYFVIDVLDSEQTVHSNNVCFVSKNSTCHCNIKNDGYEGLVKNLTTEECRSNLSKSYEVFCEVMSQFDCSRRYSVKWNCSHCFEAYIDWLVEVFTQNGQNGTNHLKTKCEKVLARCPYFLPKDSYGDAPAFDCPQKEEDYDSWSCQEYG